MAKSWGTGQAEHRDDVADFFGRTRSHGPGTAGHEKRKERGKWDTRRLLTGATRNKEVEHRDVTEDRKGDKNHGDQEQ